MNGIKIKGTGLAVPERSVTNQDLTKLVDTNEEWILSRTGIETRQHLSEGEELGPLMAEAARKALDCAGIAPEEIGLCIVATLTPDHLVPSSACYLQQALGLPTDIPCFDLNAACTGFLFALHTAECLLNASPRHYGLVLGAEQLSRVTNWEDRSTCILFGDAAAAVVVECREGWPSLSAELGCSGSTEILSLPGVGSPAPSVIAMEGQKVFKFAVQAVPYCIDRVLERSGTSMEEIDFFVFHQANARIIDLVVKKYHIPPEKYYKNIEHYGNTSSASIPLVLAELHADGRLHPGSRVLLVGFGGGLTWGGALIELTAGGHHEETQ